MCTSPSFPSDPVDDVFVDDVFAFAAEDNVAELGNAVEQLLSENSDSADTTWNIAIVDDEPSVHRATELALRNFTFEGKSLAFYSAYSGEEGKHLLSAQHPQIALVLLDVVMETHDAGLRVAQFIREELDNRQVRIILRTGQPGEAPEESVILNYDINDYKLKVELTRQRLITSTVSSLRAYRDILTIEHQRQELAQALSDLRQAQAQLKTYSHGLEMEVAKRTSELREANQKLHRLAMLDGLTQVANRRHFDEYLQAQWKLMGQLQQQLSLVLVDVDFFKNFNDAYGHLSGDDCLKRVAHVLQLACKRPHDLVARFGGEEFALVLPFTSSEGASRVAKTISEALEQLQIPHEQSQVSKYVTVSMGISSIVPQLEFSLETLLATADQALYEAKRSGRNCFCIYAQPQLSALWQLEM
ncbi:MAG TPA: diguanylate cyclase [Stenomitos sp.]